VKALSYRHLLVLDDVGLRRPTLDDVFLSLTGHRAELDLAADDDEDQEVAV
jgi:ABC-2 type transport system ATP-binding protein